MISTTVSPVIRTHRGVAVLMASLGVALITLGAYVAFPLPGTAVPFTMQVPAVLLVGGMLGPRLAAVTAISYLALGMAGLPVFAPGGLPGLARLFGPTGGYLLAYPVAALVMARCSAPLTFRGITLGILLGVATVYLGGVAQLLVLTGDWTAAVAMGVMPFLLSDLLKGLFVGLLVGKFGRTVRALV